jgi:hypothetical protein
MCKQLDWQIDCAAQICNALIPALSGVERFTLDCFYRFQIPTELQNGAIDSTTWHELLRPFIGVKELHIDPGLLEELSRALQVDEVGSDPGFLPNLQSIAAEDNLFTSFIDTRRVVGRPVEFFGPFLCPATSRDRKARESPIYSVGCTQLHLSHTTRRGITVSSKSR